MFTTQSSASTLPATFPSLHPLLWNAQAGGSHHARVVKRGTKNDRGICSIPEEVDKERSQLAGQPAAVWADCDWGPGLPCPVVSGNDGTTVGTAAAVSTPGASWKELPMDDDIGTYIR